jgi:Gpi18-like mannosyltransferase
MTVNSPAKNRSKTKVKTQQKATPVVAVEPREPLVWRKWHSVIAWGIAAVAAVIGFQLWSSVDAINGDVSGFPIDDSWIHLTFARTLAQTGHFAYGAMNPATSGSTSPLFTVLESILFFFTSNEFFIAKSLSIIGFAFAVFFVFKAVQAARPEFSWLPVAASALVIVSPRLYPAAVWGMETTLAAALIAAAAYCYERRSWLWLGVTLGLSIWCRPDLILVSVAIAIDFFLFKRDEKIDWVKLLAPAFFLMAAYAVFNLALSGSLFPNTFAAKLAYYKVHKADFWGASWAFFTKDGQGFMMALALVGLAGVIFSLVKKERIVPIYPFLIAIGYVALYNWKLPYLYQDGRYLVPVAVALILCASLGSTVISTILNRRNVFVTALPLLLCVVAVALQLNTLSSTDAANHEATEEAYITRLQVNSAKWLAKNLPKNAAVATHDIGAIGYYSGRKTIDVVGLVDPEIIPHIGDPKATVAFMRKRGATHAAFLDNWFEIVNENPVWVNAQRESERMIVYPVTDSTKMAGETLLSIHRYMRELIANHSTEGFAEALQAGISREPDDALTYILAAELMLELHRNEQAKPLLETALKLFPNSLWARQDYQVVTAH